MYETASLIALKRLLTFCKRIKPLLRATTGGTSANQLVGVAPSPEFFDRILCDLSYKSCLPAIVLLGAAAAWKVKSVRVLA